MMTCDKNAANGSRRLTGTILSNTGRQANLTPGRVQPSLGANFSTDYVLGTDKGPLRRTTVDAGWCQWAVYTNGPRASQSAISAGDWGELSNQRMAGSASLNQ